MYINKIDLFVTTIRNKINRESYIYNSFKILRILKSDLIYKYCQEIKYLFNFKNFTSP